MKRLQEAGISNRTIINMEEIVDRFRVMRHQEETSYCYQSYIPISSNNSSMDIVDTHRDINVIWREKICQWSYNVVDQYVSSCALICAYGRRSFTSI
jgi:hypothetical protein